MQCNYVLTARSVQQLQCQNCVAAPNGGRVAALLHRMAVELVVRIQWVYMGTRSSWAMNSAAEADSEARRISAWGGQAREGARGVRDYKKRREEAEITRSILWNRAAGPHGSALGRNMFV